MTTATAEGTFQRETAKPSAIISDGVLTVPLFAVTAMTLSQTFHLPPLGMSGLRARVASHDDTISLTGLLLGKDRFTWKFLLERLAEGSKAGTIVEAFGAALGGAFSGLVLITAMSVRTDMQVQSLSFSATAQRRDALEVSLSMVHVPPPGVLPVALDLANLVVRGLGELGG